MADYYNQFSEMVSDLTPDEIYFFEVILNPDRIPKELEKQFDPESWGWPPCGYEFEKEDNVTHLWIHSEDSFNLEGVANFIQHFLKQFRSKQCFTLTWAATCSRPRVGEFSGGGVFITAEKQKWHSAYDFIHKCHRRFEKKKK